MIVTTKVVKSWGLIDIWIKRMHFYILNVLSLQLCCFPFPSQAFPPKASFQPCHLCLQCPLVKILPQCLQLRQYRALAMAIFLSLLSLSACVTTHIKKYLKSKCVANLLLHEVTHRTRLHQFPSLIWLSPVAPVPWGSDTVSVPFMSRKINGFALNKCRGLDEELRTACFLLP